MPSRTPDVEKRLEALIRKTRAKQLVILGDVKHRVPGISFQEEREVPQLLGRLSKKVSVGVVPGNHDGWLEKLSPDIIIHPSDGIALGSGHDRGGGRQFWLSHGHAWPSDMAMKADTIIIGHNHPQVEFRDRLGKAWREKAWVRAKLSKKLLSRHYKKLPRALPDLILMPAFGELVGGWAVNRLNDDGKLVGGLGPITRCADMKHALVYLLDGTFLGEVSKI